MIADLDPKEFKWDVERLRLLRVRDYQDRAWYWREKNRADRETADFARRLAAETDPYMRCAMLGQNLSPRGKPALVLEEKWWKWGGYG